jgi:cytochrome bd-type quinol oxidase subunit 2
MTVSGGRLAAALWIGFGASIAGRLLDLQWHVTHDEFETAGDQVRAHWLAWLGAVVLLVAVAVALSQRRASPALTALFVGTAGYAVVSVWHFYEHSQHRDPDLPHVLLAVTLIAMLVGAPLAALTLRRERHA